jgi:hypothetical protein
LIADAVELFATGGFLAKNRDSRRLAVNACYVALQHIRPTLIGNGEANFMPVEHRRLADSL